MIFIADCTLCDSIRVRQPGQEVRRTATIQPAAELRRIVGQRAAHLHPVAGRRPHVVRHEVRRFDGHDGRQVPTHFPRPGPGLSISFFYRLLHPRSLWRDDAIDHLLRFRVR